MISLQALTRWSACPVLTSESYPSQLLSKDALPSDPTQTASEASDLATTPHIHTANTNSNTNSNPSDNEIEHAEHTSPENDAAAAEKAIQLAQEEVKRGERKPQFPIDNALNEKIILFRGDLLRLEVDCIVNSTNERISDYTGLAGRIMRGGGQDFIAEIQNGDGCPTGDAIIMNGYKLPQKYVVHTVGPKYTVKYQTAAENALNSCYRRCLELMLDMSCSSIGIPIVYTEKKLYPRIPATHIALRTIRKFLMLYGKNIKSIVLVVEKEEDERMYQDMLSLYFPRNELEQNRAMILLPKYTGNALGETDIEERKIRIGFMPGFGAGPVPIHNQTPSNNSEAATSSTTTTTATATSSSTTTSTSSSSSSSSSASSYSSSSSNTSSSKPSSSSSSSDSSSVNDFSFAQAQEHPDDIRRRKDAERSPEEKAAEEREKQYLMYLDRSSDLNLADIHRKFPFFYPSGLDAYGRQVMMLVGNRIPNPSQLNPDSLLCYIIATLHEHVISKGKEFVIIFFNSYCESDNRPNFSWLRILQDAMNKQCRKKLRRVFIVHSNWVLKGLMWAWTPFVKKKFWVKFTYCDRLAQLCEMFDATTLQFPQVALDYEKDVFGTTASVSSKQDQGENDGL